MAAGDSLLVFEVVIARLQLKVLAAAEEGFLSLCAHMAVCVCPYACVHACASWCECL